MKSAKWIILIASLLISSGCKSDKWNDVPLEADDVPFMIPAGVYADTDGVEHRIDSPRWVLNQGVLYDFIQWLKNDQNGINSNSKE